MGRRDRLYGAMTKVDKNVLAVGSGQLAIQRDRAEEIGVNTIDSIGKISYGFRLVANVKDRYDLRKSGEPKLDG